jgi:hypothetical protein
MTESRNWKAWVLNDSLGQLGRRLSELADYRKIHGHCNVPAKYSENTKLGNWVNQGINTSCT